MNTISLTTISLVLLLAVTAPLIQAQEPLALKLEEAIALALRENINVRNAYLTRIGDKFSLRIAEWNFEPQYDLFSDVTRTSGFDEFRDERFNDELASIGAAVSLNLPTGGFIGFTAAQSGFFPDKGDEAFDSSLTFNLVQPLLRNGGLTVGTASLVQAKLAEQSSLLGLRDTLAGTIVQVITQYRSYNQALRSLEISELALERAERQVEITQALINAGRTPQLDLVQSETNLANQKLSLRTAINTADAARVQLLQTLRLPPTIQLVLTEPLNIERQPLDLEELTAVAFANRTDFLQSQIALDSAELNRAVARNSQLWQLDFSASYVVSGTSRNSPADSVDFIIEEGGYVVGLTLNVPINDLSRKQILVNADIQLTQTRNQFVDLQTSIRLELADLVRNAEILWEQVELAEQALDLSRRQLDIEQQKLRVGRSSSFEVLQLQNDLEDAENNFINAQVSYLNALTNLEDALGITVKRWGVAVEPKEGLGIDDINRYRLPELPN